MFKFKFTAVILLMLGAFAFSGCSDDGGYTDAIVSIAAIPGVTVPVLGAVPVTTITETDQYTGTVSWSPSHATFFSLTVYTATITLTAKSGYTLTGVAEDFFTVAGATSDTNSADSGVVTAVFPATAPPNLRDTGPAGGLIFHITDNGNGTKTYYEAAPNTWNGGTADPSIVWQNLSVLIGAAAQGTAIGTGQSNTTAIVNWLNTNGQSGRTAQIVDSLSFGGKDDWFLPSKDELYEMCWILHSLRWNGSAAENNPAYGSNRVGGFAGDNYWSSSESNAVIALSQNFDYGGQSNNDKSSTLFVRAVRAFIN